MRTAGFTLTEMLIAIAILGVIATFTIPKVITAQQNKASNAIAKEAAATISSAFYNYKQTHTVTGSTSCGDLTPYLNYVKIDTATVMDDINLNGTNTCSSSSSCLVLHNGAAIMYCDTDDYFGGTATTNAIFLQLDPDGRYGGSTTGPSKSVLFYMYTNGRITSVGNILPGTYSSGSVHNPAPTYDPSWFNWN